MKEVIRKHTLQTLFIWIVVYIIWSFITWNFFNPFKWIINIPTYSYEHRGIGLFFWILYTGVSIVAWKDYYKTKNK